MKRALLLGGEPASKKALVDFLSLTGVGLLGVAAFVGMAKIPGLRKAWSDSSWPSLCEWSDADDSCKFVGDAGRGKAIWKRIFVLLILAGACCIAVLALTEL